MQSPDDYAQRRFTAGRYRRAPPQPPPGFAASPFGFVPEKFFSVNEKEAPPVATIVAATPDDSPSTSSTRATPSTTAVEAESC